MQVSSAAAGILEARLGSPSSWCLALTCKTSCQSILVLKHRHCLLFILQQPLYPLAASAAVPATLDAAAALDVYCLKGRPSKPGCISGPSKLPKFQLCARRLKAATLQTCSPVLCCSIWHAWQPVLRYSCAQAVQFDGFWIDRRRHQLGCMMHWNSPLQNITIHDDRSECS